LLSHPHPLTPLKREREREAGQLGLPESRQTGARNPNHELQDQSCWKRNMARGQVMYSPNWTGSRLLTKLGHHLYVGYLASTSSILKGVKLWPILPIKLSTSRVQQTGSRVNQCGFIYTGEIGKIYTVLLEQPCKTLERSKVRRGHQVRNCLT
jgi:hypothetical protein